MSACIIMLVGVEDLYEQIRLRDDTIYRLKQEMATMQQRIEDLEHENKDHKKGLLSLAIVMEDVSNLVYITYNCSPSSEDRAQGRSCRNDHR